MQTEGSTFLVTGGCSGLGAACVQRLATAGARVLIADLREPAAGTPAAEMLRLPQVAFHRVDVTNTAEVTAAIELACQHWGALHGVVNCAGILAASRIVGRDGPHDLDLFRRVIEVNLIGTFNVLRLAAQRMADNPPQGDGERGVVVNTASVSAFEGQIGQAAYAASKGGVAALSLPAARDLARHGIRVVAIAPGVFHTAMIDAAPDKVQQSLRGQTVFPARLGLPAEFAALVQHIFENPMFNGSVVRLDGAMRMGPY